MSYLKRTSTGLNDLQWSTDLETRISSLESRLTSLEGSVIRTYTVTSGNFDNLTNTGIYFINSSTLANHPAGNTSWGTLFVVAKGTINQIFIPDNENSPIYRRNGSNQTMIANKTWTQMAGSNYGVLVNYVMLKIIAGEA